MRLLDKLAAVLRFLRYGPTQAERLAQRLDAANAADADLAAADAALAAADAALAAAAQADRERIAATEAAHGVLQGLIVEAHQKIVSVGQDLERAQQRAEVAQAAGAQALGELAASLRRDLEAVRNQLSGLAAALDRAAAGSSSPAAAAAPPSAGALAEGFYPMLEQHFRGSEADVKRRLAAYRDRVDAMPAGAIADLGCGRGEWLELLASWGREALGVDSNALVAAELRERKLRIEEGDALAWLQRQPDASLAGLTAFHLIEHLPFGAVLRLFIDAHRVLKPGGVLIVETPNPENLEVATQTFWLDPTHQRPLPAALVELAARYCGFAQPTVLRLNPPETGDAPGRDYALIASKAAAQ